ncbi:MAG TPA: hypothetical protein VFA81_09785 [Burkholderiales bacterium]|nr:hypothetical protein [Burkholderiales bacterium]
MSQASPAPVAHVPRDEVANVVGDVMSEKDVKWVAIVFESSQDGVDRFTITPWITDPRESVDSK